MVTEHSRMKVRYPQSLTTVVLPEFSRLPFVLLHGMSVPSLHTESTDSVIIIIIELDRCHGDTGLGLPAPRILSHQGAVLQLYT